MDKTEADILLQKQSWAARRRETKPKAVSLPTDRLIDVYPLDPARSLPLVITPAVPELSLPDWTRNNREFIEDLLRKHGALLFRSFRMKGVADFQEYLDATAVELMNYMESATPRTELSEKVYTSTEFPPNQHISLHNELTYVVTWPMKIWFMAVTPPETGGETPIADVRRVFERLDDAIKAPFMSKGWMLVRNFGDGLGLPWKTSFHLDNRADAESYFNRSRIQYEWKDEDRLRTRQVRPAVAQHPKTAEKVWFNHVAFWHVSSLPAEVREAMLSVFNEDELPYNTYYGDGSPIEDSIVQEIRAAYAEETVVFPWQKGDLLMLDNMLVAHGRNPFSGERKVIVAMAEPFSSEEDIKVKDEE